MTPKKHRAFYSVVCLLFVLTAGDLHSEAQSKQVKREAGVFPAPPEMISYDRVAPLLDGLYEDVAAIQLSPLQLSATNPNGTSLDAVQQSLQVSASYNALDALQNSANANLFKSNAAYQGSIIDQMTALSSGLTDASIASSKAQTTLSALQAQANPAASAADLANAQSQATNLAAQVSQLTAQMTALKAAQSSTSIASFTSTTPNTTTQNAAGGAPSTLAKFSGSSSTLSPTVPSIAPTAAPNGSATLPPTRQMDTQIGLLWDRVMRLLSTIGEPDSERDVHFELLRFYPSVTYIDQQTQTLRLEYVVACNSNDSRQPKVLDLYPRTSPVNIIKEKYKDNSFSLAAFLGFAAANASAAYNREHLQLTNSMAQASYVTGFGAGTNTFGWILGKALGDDTITLGQKEMYALVAVPNSCGNGKNIKFGVQARRVVWQGQNGKALLTLDKTSDPSLRSHFETEPPKVDQAKILQMRYAQSDGTIAVPVTITLDKPVDSQARVIVNGAVLSRSRDNFARGTALGAGTSSNNVGIFESQGTTLVASSWSRTTENQITMLLDPKAYGSRFPEIVITSQQGEINILDEAIDGLTVNGLPFTCRSNSCRASLPPLKTPSGTLQLGTARRWQSGSTASKEDVIVIGLLSDQNAAGLDTANASGRIVSTSPSVQTWGTSPRVTAIRKSDGAAYDVASCRAFGASLLCQAWDDYGNEEYAIQVSDDHHAGDVAVRSEIRLTASSPNDRMPLIVSLPPPTQQPEQQNWFFQYAVLANKFTTAKLFTTGGNVVLGGAGVDAIAPPNLNCTTNASDPCVLSFVVPYASLARLQDRMQMEFFSPAGTPIGGAQLFLLRSVISPRLTAVDNDLRLHGANLIFDSLRFGKGGPIAKLECVDDLRTDCKVDKAPKVPATTYVYLYQARNGAAAEQYYPLPLFPSSSGAQSSYWTYVSPKPEKPVPPINKSEKGDKVVSKTSPAKPAVPSPAPPPKDPAKLQPYSIQ